MTFLKIYFQTKNILYFVILFYLGLIITWAYFKTMHIVTADKIPFVYQDKDKIAYEKKMRTADNVRLERQLVAFPLQIYFRRNFTS